MRLTVMGQMVKAVAAEIPAVACREEEPPNGADVQHVQRNLERLKWHLWHNGIVYRALQVVEEVMDSVEVTAEYFKNAKKLLKAVSEFEQYIRANRASFPTSGTATGMGRRSAQRLWNPRSTKWSANEW